MTRRNWPAMSSAKPLDPRGEGAWCRSRQFSPHSAVLRQRLAHVLVHNPLARPDARRMVPSRAIAGARELRWIDQLVVDAAVEAMAGMSRDRHGFRR